MWWRYALRNPTGRSYPEARGMPASPWRLEGDDADTTPIQETSHGKQK